MTVPQNQSFREHSRPSFPFPPHITCYTPLPPFLPPVLFTYIPRSRFCLLTRTKLRFPYISQLFLLPRSSWVVVSFRPVKIVELSYKYLLFFPHSSVTNNKKDRGLLIMSSSILQLSPSRPSQPCREGVSCRRSARTQECSIKTRLIAKFNAGWWLAGWLVRFLPVTRVIIFHLCLRYSTRAARRTSTTRTAMTSTVYG